MAQEAEQLMGDILLATSTAPRGTILKLLDEAKRNRQAGKKETLDQYLVDRGLCSAVQAARLRRWAAEVADAPRINGFLLLKRRGSGRAGAVYKARRQKLKTDVAIRILPAEKTADPQYVKLVHKRADTAAKLDNSNLVRVYSAGEENGSLYIVTEYVDGRSVADLLRQKKKFLVGDALRIVADVAQALQYAHKHNVYHGDVRPSSLLVDKTGTVKLADVGLSEVLRDRGADSSDPYRAPELVREAKAPDARADLYSLGVCLYQMLTCELPFPTATPPAGQFTKASKRNPKVPKRVDELLDRLLSIAPEDRPPNTADLLKELESRHELPTRLSFLRPTTVRPALTPKATTESEPQGSKRKRFVIPDAKPLPAAPAPSSAASTGGANEWYLRMDDIGEPVKYDAAAVRTMIQNRQIDGSVEASQSPTGPFRRLGTYVEFESSVRSLTSRSSSRDAMNTVESELVGLLANMKKSKVRQPQPAGQTPAVQRAPQKQKLADKPKSNATLIWVGVGAGIVILLGVGLLTLVM